MNIKRATALALSLSLLLGAAACGKSGSEAADTGSKTSAQLLEEENAILGAHQELWDQVFASMDKSSPATSKNYGDVLLSAVENCKDKLSDDIVKEVTDKVNALKEALKGDDTEKVKTAQTELMTAAQKIGQVLYAQQGAEGAAAGADGAGASAGSASGSDDDTVEAEVVDDDDDKDNK